MDRDPRAARFPKARKWDDRTPPVPRRRPHPDAYVSAPSYRDHATSSRRPGGPRSPRPSPSLSPSPPRSPSRPRETGSEALEREIEDLHKRNDPKGMLKLFVEAKSVGLKPTAQTYLHLLSSLSLADDAANMQTIYDELFMHRNITLSPQQYHDVIFTLSQSPLKQRVLKLYAHLRKKNVQPIQSPQTYRLLISCCTERSEAMTLFQDMKKSDMNLTASIYNALLQIVVGDPQKTVLIVEDMKLRGFDPADALAIMKGPEVVMVAEAVLQAKLPISAATWEQIGLNGGPGTSERLHKLWRKYEAVQSEAHTVALLDAAVHARVGGLAFDLWDHTTQQKWTVPENRLLRLLQLMVDLQDVR